MSVVVLEYKNKFDDPKQYEHEHDDSWMEDLDATNDNENESESESESESEEKDTEIIEVADENITTTSDDVISSTLETVSVLVVDENASYEDGGVDRLKAMEKFEPMLNDPNEERFTLFPIVHHDIWELCQEAEETDWRASEIDLAYDAADWIELTDNEKHFISMVLGFFVASDGAIIENLACRFLKDVKWAEVRAFYAFQIKIETTHSQVYSELVDVLVKDKMQKKKLFNAVKNFPCIREKSAWAKKWIDNDRASFARRLVAFSAVEGIQFAGSFAAIWWLKKRGKMPGLCFSNYLISRDEGQHTKFACLLYKKLKHKLTQKEIEDIICGAVDSERKFITEAIPCSMIGMNQKEMSTYIEFVADRLVKQLGYKPIYNASNPFVWMENIGSMTRTNFFEKRVGEYEKKKGKTIAKRKTKTTTIAN